MIGSIEKAYITMRGTLSDPREAANWMFKYIVRKFGSGTSLDVEQTTEVVTAFAKRYECDYYTAEKIIAGLAYYPDVTRIYNFGFYRNFGQYNIYMEKKKIVRRGGTVM